MAGRLARVSLAVLLLTASAALRRDRSCPARGAEGPEHRAGGDERPDRRHRRLRGRPADRLRRRGDGRRLEVDERRAHVRAGVRRAAGPRDRRRRRRPADARRRLGRHGRGEPAQQHLARRRRLPDARRREDVDERRPREDGADPPDPPPPARPADGLGLRRRPRLGRRDGARRLPDDGRREELEEGPPRRREDGLRRPRARPGQSRPPPRGDVGLPPDASQLPLGRPRFGAPRDVGRRGELDEAGREGRGPEGAARPDRTRLLRRASGGRLRRRRGREERPPPLGERRPALRGRERLPVGQPAPLLLRRHPGRPPAAESRLLARDAAARLDGRREDVREPPRDGPTAGPRGPPRPLDRPEGAAADAARQRRRDVREPRPGRHVPLRRDAAARAVLPRGRRRRDPLQRLRGAAGQQLLARAVVGLAAGRDPGAPLEGGRRG